MESDAMENKRVSGEKLQLTNRISRRMQVNNDRRRPVKNYDFYDQPNDFEWFGEQGHNRYPYKGTQGYSHEGYEEYQKPPDVHAVAQAMQTLEKHMSSSEALGSDNMFRNREGGHRDHQENNHGVMMMNNDNNDNDSDGRYGERYEGTKESEHESHKDLENENHNEENGHSMMNDDNGVLMMHHDRNDNVEDGHIDSHQSEWENGENGRADSDKDGGGRKNEGQGHLTEHYKWDNIKGPNLLNGEGLPSNEKSNDVHREGWLPLKQHESQEESQRNHNDHEGSPNREHHGSTDHGSEVLSNHHVEDKNMLGGVSHENHDESDANHGDHERKAVSTNLQHKEPKEDYIDFPKTEHEPNLDNENRNRNNLEQKPSPPMADSPPVHVPSSMHDQNVVKSHSNNIEPAQSLEKPIEKPIETPIERPLEKPIENTGNLISVNVGYPHYHVPNTHEDSAKNEPHEGPERGGGLWGDLPGEGEQYVDKGSTDEGLHVGMQKQVSVKPSVVITTKGNNGDLGNRLDANEGSTFAAKGVGAKEVRIEAGSNGTEAKEKKLKVTRIPVTIKTGVYDSREIFTIDGDKKFIKNERGRNTIMDNKEYVARGEKLRKSVMNIVKEKEKKRLKDIIRSKKNNGLKLKEARKSSRDRKTTAKKLTKNEGLETKNKRMKNCNDKAKGLKSDEVLSNGKGMGVREGELRKRHGTDNELGAVHGHPVISDEQALHSSPEELLEMANGYRHRAEEYDSKAKELENQAEIQDHQFDHHGAVSQHQPHHQGPERGGNLGGGEHGEGEQYHHGEGIGPWSGPTWHGPGPFGSSQFGHHGGHGEGHGGGHGEGHGGGHGEGHGEGHEEGHDHHMVHFNTGYPYYHVPQAHSLPLIEYHKPAPPVHGLNPYEVLTSEQFHHPHLPAGHGNLPYGHNQRSLHSKSEVNDVIISNKVVSKSDGLVGQVSIEPGTIVELPKYDVIPKDYLSDDNINSFLLKR